MEKLNLFTSVESSVKDSSKTLNTSLSDIKKEGSSLFDSLLKESNLTLTKEGNTSSSNNNTAVKEQVKNTAGEQNKTTTIIKNELNTNPNPNSTSPQIKEVEPKSNVNTQELTKNSSLNNTQINNSANTLNKIVVDTKTTTTLTNNSSVALNNTQINNSAINQTQQEIVQKDNSVEIKTINVNNTQTQSLTDNPDTEQNKTTTVIKNELNTNPNPNSTSPQIKEVEPKSNVDAQEFVNLDGGELTVSEETKQNIANIQNVVLKNESSNEDSLSLMDKLLNDAKQQINQTKTGSDEVSIVPTKIDEVQINQTRTKSDEASIIPTKVDEVQIITEDNKSKNIENQEPSKDNTKEILSKNFDSIKIETPVAQNIQDTKVNQNIKIENRLNTPDASVEAQSISNQLKDVQASLTPDIKLNTNNQTEIDTSKALNGLTQDAIVKEEISVKSSLLDDLIKKATAEITKEIKNETPELNNNLNILNRTIPQKEEVLGNIFLGLQKNSVTSQNIINTSIARSVLANATNLNDVKKASEVLNLNAQEIQLKVENNELLKDVDIVKLDRKISILDKVMTNIQKLDSINFLTTNFLDTTKTEVNPLSSLTETINEAEDVTLSVNQNLANNIQARIIGARQQMSTMMSDLARTMYENYKPPVTTFKINLNPANLGMISVVIKNERDNSISISMNMSNNATLEAVLDNQNSLRGALFRAFGDEERSFNLDFGSNQNPSNQNSNDEEFANSLATNSEDSLQSGTNIEQEDSLTYL